MSGQQKWTEWIRKSPGWTLGAIGLISTVVAFLILFKDNFHLVATVTVAIGLLALLLLCIYLAFAKTPPLVNGGRGVYRFENGRRWALAGIVLIPVASGAILLSDRGRSFVAVAAFGTPTPTATPTVMPTATSTATPTAIPTPTSTEAPTAFSVNLNANQYVEERQLSLTGHGLPRGAEIEVRVYRLSEGDRVLVPQERGELVPKESGEWRYQWVRFEEGGDHELDFRVLQDGQPVDFCGPVRIHVGAWVPAPQAFATSEPTLTRPAPAVTSDTVDLSEWVTIHHQGREGTSPAVAAVTAMETSLAWKGEPALLSARYVYEKAKRHDELGVDTAGTWLTTIAYIIQQFGAPAESAWPYSPGERALPEHASWTDLDSLAARNKAHLYRVSSYDEILGHLEHGRPVLTGVRVYGGSWFSAEEAQRGEIPAPSPGDKLTGLHAIVVVAYDQEDLSIRFANCWGPTWGDEGFGSMTQEVAGEVLIADQMWAVEMLR